MALPVFLSLNFLLGSWLGLIPGDRRIRVREAILAALGFGFCFEVLVPIWSQRAIADPWDVLAYLAGGLLLVWMERFDFTGSVGQ